MQANTVRRAARLAVPLAGALVLAALACQKSETIAPADATISLAANPAQVVTAGGIQVAPVEIVATVRSSIGVPLPGQDVRSTTTSGQLDPPAQTPVTTDDLGNAECTLTLARTGPKITATSGKATADISLTASPGDISSIALDPNQISISSCSDGPFTLTATVRGPDGTGVEGVTVYFDWIPADSQIGNIIPSNDVSDASGIVTVELDIDSTLCNNLCVGDSTTIKDCTTIIRARDFGNVILSNDLNVIDANGK